LDWCIELLKSAGQCSDFTAAHDLNVKLGSLGKVRRSLDYVDSSNLTIESFLVCMVASR